MAGPEPEETAETTPAEPDPPGGGAPGELRGKHRATLAAIFAKPTRANIKQRDVEALFKALGGHVDDSSGSSSISVSLDGLILILHRPHPSPDMDKGAVESVRKFLSGAGYSC